MQSPGSDKNNSSWVEWSRHVLLELERLNSTVEKASEKLQEYKINMEGRITTLEEKEKSIRGQIKIGLGIIISGVSAGITWIFKHLFN